MPAAADPAPVEADRAVTGPHRPRATPARSRGLGGLLALAAVLLTGAVVLVPREPPGLRHTSVLNVLFDDRWVVGGTRTVGLAVAVYVLASILVRVSRDQWLRHVGPADVGTDESIQQVALDRADLQQALDGASATIGRLRQEYADLLAAQAAQVHDGRQRER